MHFGRCGKGMQLSQCNISGVYIIDGLRFKDIRGELIKPYSENFMPSDININFKETWFTKSKKNVIRGMHLQVEPYACEKIVSVISGKIIDVLLDLRKASESYGQVFSIELSENTCQSIYIPKGVAHGYCVKKESIVMYMATEVNVTICDVGIKWNSFGYDWGVKNPILSEKDKLLPDYNEFLYYENMKVNVLENK